ncbi:MAG: hypothetical protein LH606_20230 [Cytophagaceae bacterium]|nr:hypothetical protein [Cytophagaceae bacterium]
MKHLLLLALLLAAGTAFGQNLNALQNTRSFSLKSIEVGPGPRYFYDGRRIGSNPDVLQVPFMQLADGDVLRRYRKARSFGMAAGAVAFAPLAYLFTQRNSGFRTDTFAGLYAGAIGMSLGFTLSRNHTLKQAVQMYNERIVNDRYGRFERQNPLPQGLSQAVSPVKF